MDTQHNSEKKAKCFVYFRRSQDREDRQYNSLEKQDRNTRQVVKSNGLDAIFLPPEERSAYKPGRPIFNDMVQQIKDHKARYIAVWHHSRLSRNALDGGQIIQLMDDGDLLAIHTPGKTFRNTAEDKAFLAFNLTFAKKNNDDLSDQVRDSFVEKRLHGEYPGPAPMGYVNAILGPKTRNIIPDPQKAPKVIECFEFASTELHSLDDVWKHAIDIGLESRAGNTVGKQTIGDMLQRRMYTGVFKYGGAEWHKGTYTPLISTDLFDKVQLAMGWTKPYSGKKPSTTSGRYYPYKGLFLCGTCKFNVTAYTKGKKLANGADAEYKFYTCTKKNKKLVCKEPQVPSMELEQDIMTSLGEYSLTERDANECRKWIQELFNSHIKKKSQYKPLWLIEQQKARTALDVLDEKLEVGTITDERYKARAEKHEETLARTMRLINDSGSDARAWLELSNEVFSRAVNIGEVFEDANDEERRELMKYVGSNWYLSNKKVVLTVREPLSALCHNSENPNWRAIAEQVWNYFVTLKPARLGIISDYGQHIQPVSPL